MAGRHLTEALAESTYGAGITAEQTARIAAIEAEEIARIAADDALVVALDGKEPSIPPGTFVDVPEGTPEVGQVPVVTDDSPLTFGWGQGGIVYADGLEADRPDADEVAVNAVFFATDSKRFFRSNGVDTWTQLSGFGDGLYGDGSDGDVVISTVVSLSRDMFYENLTITATGDLNTNGFIPFVRDLGWVQTGGRVHHNGQNATAIGGLGATGGTVGLGNNGANGSTGAGASSANLTNALGGQGGAGGTGNGGANAGGLGGTPTAPVAARGTLRRAEQAASGVLTGGGVVAVVLGGTGGGAGGGDGSGAAGPGGGAAGYMALPWRRGRYDGTVECRGGNGGTPSSGNRGGGGGGGGGVFAPVNDDKSGTNADFSAALNCPGGLGGDGSGNGTDGADGGVGSLREVSNRPL